MEPRIVSIHQPAYLPWLGYFDRIRKSDIFVLLDNVQFEKGSYTNRNKIKTANGPVWLTVPVKLKGHTKCTIKDIPIDNSQDWVDKHLDTIYYAYKKVYGFFYKYEWLQNVLYKKFDSLSDLCHYQLIWWLKAQGINTRVCRASDIHIPLGKKSDLVLDICKYIGATHYLSGPMGRGYLDEDAFKQEGVKVVYHDFVHPTYPQLWGDFIPDMGVIDWWMNSR